MEIVERTRLRKIQAKINRYRIIEIFLPNAEENRLFRQDSVPDGRWILNCRHYCELIETGETNPA